MNTLTRADRVRIIAALCEGNSVRATTRLTGCSKGAVLRLLCDMGEVCAAYHEEHVRGINARRVQADEMHTMVFCREGTAKKRADLRERADVGAAWLYVAIDAETKLVISWLIGKQDDHSAESFMMDLASRVTHRMQLSTDGNRRYFLAVPNAFEGEVDFGRVIKIFGNPQPDGRIGTTPLVCIGIEKKVAMGSPDPDHISTSFVERQNLSVRMGQRRYTRSTNGFSKKWENLCHATALHYFHFNWIRKHQTLRATPAMAAGLADRPWTIEEMVGLLESRERTAIEAGALKRGPYRKKFN